jgi:protein gp37
MKVLCAINKKKTGHLLEGRTWDEVPELRKTA